MTVLRNDESSQIVPAGVWSVDAAHSSLEFGVKHMMIATVRGRFTAFEGTLEADPQGSARASGLVHVASIDTSNRDRDDHLRSPDFFDAERYPEIRFRSTRIERPEPSTYRVFGELTIKEITREVELQASVLGSGRDPWGNDRIAIEATGELDRRDFGLEWNQPLDGGGVLVGNKVKLLLDVSAVGSVQDAAA